ncbi:hypothetical protein A4X13_0g270 [Tilletia indica]|uniref:Uncharacterized protein n=1 Tax=Tilletia indica TaxID=43049 RepID=A0A177TKM7_9BASI|nr:hypothetical protein A4X13_0g270 [Tilletia indica]
MSDYARLRALAQTLNSALKTYEDELRAAGHPDLNIEALTPKPPDATTQMAQARWACLNAMDVLRTSLQSPAEAMYQTYSGAFETSALSIAVQNNLADAIFMGCKDSDDGVSVEQLAAKVGMDPAKLARVLRMLAVRHWLRESKEGHFRLTRLGASLRQGQSVHAWIAVQCPILFPSLTELPTTLTDLVSKATEDEHQTAFARGPGCGQSMFEYLSSHPEAAEQFGLSMHAAGEIQLAASLREFPWHDRLAHKTLIDVGGGAGHFSVEFAKMDIPGLSIVVQDLPGTFEQAKRTFEKQAPEFVTSGRATFEACDFFKPNARSGENTCYLLRSILHDWGDDYCVQILKGLAHSMHPASSIFLHEILIQPCLPPSSEEPESDVQVKDHEVHLSPTSSQAAWPIPRNFGGNAAQTYALDYLMLLEFNGRERTEAQFASLAEEAGLKLVNVSPLTSGRAIFEMRRA